VNELLELVGLDPKEYGGRYPHELSGGQRQRVGVARALAADPPVLLMDEPFGAVDPIARDHLQEEFLHLQAEVRKTVVFVTHDLDEAVRLGDRIAVMSVGGHLEQFADPATILGAPATDFVRDFVGADRSLKALAVTSLRDVTLEHADRNDYERTVSIEGSLKDAFVAILESPDGCVGVLDGDQLVGKLDAAGVKVAADRLRAKTNTNASASTN
jgi:osmoprotectant transport system ATP-binding protein